MDTEETRGERIASAAMRGACIGFLISAVWFFCRPHYSEPVITDDGAEVTITGMSFTFYIGVPGSLAVALLAAWLLQLPRPWLVSLLGLLFSLVWVPACPLMLGGATVLEWLLPLLLLLAGYAIAAVIVDGM